MLKQPQTVFYISPGWEAHMSCLNGRTHKFSLKEERLKDAVNGMNGMNFRCICCCLWQANSSIKLYKRDKT